jgi:hypothetical protein
MIAIVTVRADTSAELEKAALSKAATLWNCRFERREWYFQDSYAFKLAILTDEPEARFVDSTPPGDQLHRPSGRWEATFRVGMVRA